MRRIQVFIVIFCLCLCVPLAYFIFRTHQSLDQEERGELRYFADTLFYEMEKELSDLVLTEEGRNIDEYTTLSDLSYRPGKAYILGYFQNNPDGSFQTPMTFTTASDKKNEKDQTVISDIVDELADVNKKFNDRRADVSERFEITAPEKVMPEKEEGFTLSSRYLNLSRTKSKKEFLGQEKKRVENITADQAVRLSQQQQTLSEKTDSLKGWASETATDSDALTKPKEVHQDSRMGNTYAQLETTRRQASPAPAVSEERSVPLSAGKEQNAQLFQAEVDPLQSVFVTDDEVVFFRRIMIDNQVYRQGLVILIKPFLNHLAQSYFAGQPMAAFTNLNLSIKENGSQRSIIETGALSKKPKVSLNHTFPRPFAFLRARLACDNIPPSPGRQTLNIMIAAMALVILLGLFVIYRSVDTIVGLSERRSQFVSAVTHELKTPLTNIRMYIEMLEQGIAVSPEREQEYYHILESETGRLSRLINNVLEYSKLEKKNRRLEMIQGNFDDVIHEVKRIMQAKLRQEGFILEVEAAEDLSFMYDREVMIQILMNLIENSMKFGKNNPEKVICLSVRPVDSDVEISISDTGPGIPKHALKKVFDDFFRADNELTRTTGGTGIGLALVKKFVAVMGGHVEAKNNKGPGCTITISLPMAKTGNNEHDGIDKT